ncbi:MAG: nodulation protein NfeD, partial [Gammaproteobacteria bacterium]|nr:nodulation protein NfeD [Gammaproteobacteria bacterium]
MNVETTRRGVTVSRPFSALLAAACLLAHAASFADDSIVNIELKGGIGVATAEYVIKAIEHANATDASLVLISADTPGGLVSATRDIIQAILASDVPVATYVTPAGARADSAGTYILLASHIAAMAPTTHIGAATPVSMTGDGVLPSPADFGPKPATDDNADESGPAPAAPPQGSAMDRKVINDAVAYIRTLAERHGRNADWAERAVTEAATLTAREALAENIVEYVVGDTRELFAAIDGLV